MPAFLSLIAMNSLDWMAYGLLLFCFGGILGALFLYLRTAYKSGGWKRVRRDFLLALGALVAFFLVRILENQELDSLKDAIDGWFK